MKLLSISIFVLSTVFVSCQKKQSFDAASIEIEVTEMLHAYDDSVRKNGVEGGFYFLDKSDAFYWVPPDYKYAIDYDSISSILHAHATQFKHIDNQWKGLRVMPLSEKYASFNGVVISTAITTENDTTITKLAETGIVVKRKEGWKLLSGQTTLVD